MARLPRVSVLMITYNHEHFIKQALESALAQNTNFEYEIVVGEDCSTDRTRSIIVQYEQTHSDKVRLLLRNKNLGMVRNFITTFRECRGEYVAILEGDDYWTSPLKLQRQVSFLEAYNDYSMSFHKALLVGEEGGREPSLSSQDPGKEPLRVFPADLHKSTFSLEDLLISNFIPASSMVFRNYSHGKLPDMFSRFSFIDWPLAIFIAEHGKISFLNEIMSAYRYHSRSAWRIKSAVERTESTIEMLDRVNAHLEFRYNERITNTISNLRLSRRLDLITGSTTWRLLTGRLKESGAFPVGSARHKIYLQFLGFLKWAAKHVASST
ncbi:MAG: glycosyltransferase [Candidatus Bathyarchaeia archaeon]